MSDTIPAIPTQTPVASSTQLPTAAIVCIAVGGYVVLVVIILVLRQCCLARGMCGQWELCGKEEQPQCCECCISLSESCDCCKSPSVTSCLDSVCPNRKDAQACCKQFTCVDIILCQCCAGPGSNGSCDCGTCQCSCGCNTDCEYLNCCCFQVRMASTTPRPTPRTLPTSANSARLDHTGSLQQTQSLESPNHRSQNSSHLETWSRQQARGRPQQGLQQSQKKTRSQTQHARKQPGVHHTSGVSSRRTNDVSGSRVPSTRRPVPRLPMSAIS